MEPYEVLVNQPVVIDNVSIGCRAGRVHAGVSKGGREGEGGGRGEAGGGGCQMVCWLMTHAGVVLPRPCCKGGRRREMTGLVVGWGEGVCGRHGQGGRGGVDSRWPGGRVQVCGGTSAVQVSPSTTHG